MADKKIEDATQDTDVTGVEKLPVSDNGTAKCMTVAQVKDYVLAQIAAIQAAGAVDVDADGVYLLKGGALKPVDADTLAAAVLDYGFGKVAVAAMNGNEVIGVKDAADQKTITVTQLKAWLQANMTVSADIDIGAKASAGVLSGSDLFVVAQSGTNKKLTVANFTAYANAAFKDYVASLAAVENLNDADVLYVVNGTTAKKCTVAQLKTIIGAGDVIAPDTQTAGNVPAWDSTAKKLTNGYGVAGQISNTPSATKLVTEAAAATAIGEKVDKVTGKGLSTNDYTNADKAKVDALTDAAIAAWTAGKTYAVGDYCLYGGFLRRCVHAGSTQTFVETDWNYIPPYPTSEANTKFLCGDGTWKVPPTATEFTGATSEAAGTRGLVPAPLVSERMKYLKADGTWGDPAADCAKAPASTTANNIPTWGAAAASGTAGSKSLTDGLHYAPKDIIGGETLDDVSDEDSFLTLPTVLGIRQRYVKAVSTTANKIPKFATTTTSAGGERSLSDGWGVKTAFGETPTDADIPTEKAVADHVNARISATAGFAKAASKTLTAATESLSNRTVHLFGIATGGTYTLALPAAEVGRSREFYVAFTQSGTQGAVSTVNLSSTTQIHGSRNGIITSLSLTKDVAGGSQAFHVYHFFEDASQIWCVNEFEAAEGGGGGGMSVSAVSTLTDESLTVAITNNTSNCFNVTTGNATEFTFPAAGSSMREFYITLVIHKGSSEYRAFTMSFGDVGVIYEGQMTYSINAEKLDTATSASSTATTARVYHFFDNAMGLVCEEITQSDSVRMSMKGFRETEWFEATSETPFVYLLPGGLSMSFVGQSSPSSLSIKNLMMEGEVGVSPTSGAYEGTVVIDVASGATVPTLTVPKVVESDPAPIVLLPDGTNTIGDLLTAGKATWLDYTMFYEMDLSNHVYLASVLFEKRVVTANLNS